MNSFLKRRFFDQIAVMFGRESRKPTAIAPQAQTIHLYKRGNRDLIAVQSELFLLAAFFLTVGLVVDLLHRVLDPRLKTATAITEVTA